MKQSRSPQRSPLLRARKQAVSELEREIGAHTTNNDSDTTSDAEQTLTSLREQLDTARESVTAARLALKPIRAKLPANTIDPSAKRATPRINRRALQTVCRLFGMPWVRRRQGL